MCNLLKNFAANVGQRADQCKYFCYYLSQKLIDGTAFERQDVTDKSFCKVLI